MDKRDSGNAQLPHPHLHPPAPLTSLPLVVLGGGSVFRVRSAVSGPHLPLPTCSQKTLYLSLHVKDLKLLVTPCSASLQHVQDDCHDGGRPYESILRNDVPRYDGARMRHRTRQDCIELTDEEEMRAERA